MIYLNNIFSSVRNVFYSSNPQNIEEILQSPDRPSPEDRQLIRQYIEELGFQNQNIDRIVDALWQFDTYDQRLREFHLLIDRLVSEPVQPLFPQNAVAFPQSQATSQSSQSMVSSIAQQALQQPEDAQQRDARMAQSLDDLTRDLIQPPISNQRSEPLSPSQASFPLSQATSQNSQTVSSIAQQAQRQSDDELQRMAQTVTDVHDHFNKSLQSGSCNHRSELFLPPSPSQALLQQQMNAAPHHQPDAQREAARMAQDQHLDDLLRSAPLPFFTFPPNPNQRTEPFLPPSAEAPLQQQMNAAPHQPQPEDAQRRAARMAQEQHLDDILRSAPRPLLTPPPIPIRSQPFLPPTQSDTERK